MVEQSRMHLQEGHLSVMWKDTTFNYSYFLWFEDNSVCAVALYLNISIYKNYITRFYSLFHKYFTEILIEN